MKPNIRLYKRKTTEPVFVLILHSYLMDAVVGYFHLPLALSHSLSTDFQLNTWGQEEMQCVDVFYFFKLSCKSEFQWQCLKMAVAHLGSDSQLE